MLPKKIIHPFSPARVDLALQGRAGMCLECVYSGGRNLGTWRVTFLMVFLQGGRRRAATPPRRAARPCCATVLRRRAAAPRSVPPSSDEFAEPPAPPITLKHRLVRAWFLAAPAFL
jgi:hypothetical protein